MDTIIDALNTFFASFPSWLTAITAVISAASAIAALTPTPKDDDIVSRLHKLVQYLALNIGHAKRADLDAGKK